MLNFEVRTDLAVENKEIYEKAKKIENSIPGIEIESDFSHSFFHITRVRITSKEGECALNKPIGTYITLESDQMTMQVEKAEREIIQKTAKLIQEVSKLTPSDAVFIVGLGNQKVTPDSLGPNVIEKIQVTRHLLHYTPEYLPPHTRSVSAVVPRSTRYHRN